jgi:triphosphoribosyl-dephospho-CoA synthetase
MSEINSSFYESEEFLRIGKLCRELLYEAKKWNIPRGVIIHGVAWDFGAAYKEQIAEVFGRWAK